MRIPTRPALRPIALCVAALTCVAAFACEDDDAAAPSPFGEPSATSAPSPTAEPTQPPADPRLAEELREQGDFEGAVAVYSAIAAASDGEEQQVARLAQAQLLGRAGDHADARDVLRAYFDDAHGSRTVTFARFLYARTLAALGDDAGALAQYERYLTELGPAADFARAERATLLARLGQIDEADIAAREVLVSALPPEHKSTFAFRMGEAFDDGAAPLNAVSWYGTAIEQGGDVASPLARRGAAKRRLGDPSWVEDYLRVVEQYPASAPAASVLDELDEAGVPVRDFTRGFVNYRAFRNAAARDAFARALAGGERPAESAYYLGALDERADDAASAIERYAQSVLLDPNTTVADDALWWRGRLLESGGRPDEAAAVYWQLMTAYPSSEWRGDAAFHRGLAFYRDGRFAEAATSWTAIIAAATDDGERDRARYWQGLGQRRSGDDTGGNETLRALAAEAPDSFYGLRAQVVLGENAGRRGDAKLENEPVDWDAIFESIAQATGVDPKTAPVTALADSRWTVAAELDAAGLRNEATGLFLAIVRAHDGDPVELAQITRELEHRGHTSLAARSAVFLRLSLPDGAVPHEELLRVAYPPAYAELVEQAADAEDVSPLLLLALVRQESFYDPEAGSSAGALGLTQVIPSTGRSIAGELGIGDFTPEDLFRPRLSLRFGANYIASQLRAFDGNIYHALAAYNGGPRTASNAIDSAGSDIDLFVEDLEFDETKLYVKLVIENYARYRDLYEGLDGPSLPR